MLLKREQRHVLLPQEGFEIRCNCKDPVAHGSRDAVDQVVQNPYGVVCHSDLIEIRKAHGTLDHALRITLQAMNVFTTQVSCRILNLKKTVAQKSYDILAHSCLPLSSSSSGFSLYA